MMPEPKTVWLPIFLLLIGCASSQGFDRITMNEVLHVGPPTISLSNSTENQDGRLSTPLRLGIFFVNHDFPDRRSVQKLEWWATDREQLLYQLAPLRNEHILTDAFVLMDATLHGDNIREVKRVGARYGADVVLIVDGVAAVDRYNNRYAWLYPTLLGAYLAPGTQSDALVMVTGSLWAVRSEWHAPIQTVEGVSKVVGSAVSVEDSAALLEAKQQAIQALARRVVDQLRLLGKELSHTTSSSR